MAQSSKNRSPPNHGCHWRVTGERMSAVPEEAGGCQVQNKRRWFFAQCVAVLWNSSPEDMTSTRSLSGSKETAAWKSKPPGVSSSEDAVCKLRSGGEWKAFQGCVQTLLPKRIFLVNIAHNAWLGGSLIWHSAAVSVFLCLKAVWGGWREWQSLRKNQT